MMSAHYKEHTAKQFVKCLKEVSNINRLMIDKRKCDNEEHYQKSVDDGRFCLAMAMIDRMLGIVNEENSFFNRK
jgi:hypothetical protein